MKKDLLRAIKVPGWQLLTDAAKDAIIDELAALPEDVGTERVREMAPACARATEVMGALDRAASREGITEQDQRTIMGWRTLEHAGSLAAALDLATLASHLGGALSVSVQNVDTNMIGSPCLECDEPIMAGEDFQRVTKMIPSGPIAAAVHRECMALRMIGHDHGVCSCTQYAGMPTTREAARELVRRIRAENERRRAGMS